MKRFSALLLGILLLFIPRAFSAGTTSSSTSSVSQAASTCVNDIDKSLNRERYLFESVLFGVKPAEEEAAGATRVDESGTTWIKNDQDEWVNFGTQKSLSNDEMDQKTASDPLRNLKDEANLNGTDDATDQTMALRHGILETQKALTSDLIPPILQSFRAFQCRVESVCEGVSQVAGYQSGNDQPMTIDIPGCEEQSVQPIRSCEPSPLINDWNDLSVIRTHCGPVMKALVQYQEAQLIFLAHEDASQRSLRQFAGFLEPTLEKLRFPFVSPIRQTTDFLNEWNRIPCFLPYCAP